MFGIFRLRYEQFRAGGAGVPLVEPMQESAMRLDGEEAPYEEIAAAIEGVEGVLAQGLLLHTVTEALVVGPDGPQTLRKVRLKWSCYIICGAISDLYL